MKAKADPLGNADIPSPRAEHVAAHPKKLRNPARFFVLLVIFLWGLFPLLIYSGLFAYWYQYTTAPVQGASLLGTGSFEQDNHGSIYLQAADGTIHAYYTWGNGWYTWQEPEIVSQTCTPLSLRLSTVFAPFNLPIQCVYSAGDTDFGTPPRLFFVLDQQGRLWGAYSLHGPLSNEWATYLFGSLLVGLAASLVYQLVYRLRCPPTSHADRLSLHAQGAAILHGQARLWSFTNIAGLVSSNLFPGKDAIPLALDIGTAAGLLLGWFLPLPGGVLVIMVTLLRALLDFNDARNSYALPEFLLFWLILVVPAALYLLTWNAQRKLKREQATSPA